MSIDDLKSLTQRYNDELWNKKNLAIIDEMVAPDFVDRDQVPGLPAGREGVKVFAQMYISAFPDVQVKIEDIIVEGNKVVFRWTANGKHTGALMGIPPTGKSATVKGISINHYRGNQIAEGWNLFDQLGMLQQLGIVPFMAG